MLITEWWSLDKCHSNLLISGDRLTYMGASWFSRMANVGGKKYQAVAFQRVYLSVLKGHKPLPEVPGNSLLTLLYPLYTEELSWAIAGSDMGANKITQVSTRVETRSVPSHSSV